MVKKQKPAAASVLRARSIKVSDEDWQQWQAAASIVDGGSVSAWLKRIARREVRRARKAGEL